MLVSIFFTFIIILNFLFFTSLFTDFYKSTENVCEQWEITVTNNRIRLLIFDDESFLFSQSVPKQLISLL